MEGGMEGGVGRRWMDGSTDMWMDGGRDPSILVVEGGPVEGDDGWKNVLSG